MDVVLAPIALGNEVGVLVQELVGERFELVVDLLVVLGNVEHLLLFVDARCRAVIEFVVVIHLAQDEVLASVVPRFEVIRLERDLALLVPGDALREDEFESLVEVRNGDDFGSVPFDC